MDNKQSHIIEKIKRNIIPLEKEILTTKENIAQYNLLLTNIMYIKTKVDSRITLNNNFNTSYQKNEEGKINNIYCENFKIKINHFPMLTFNVGRNIFTSDLPNDLAEVLTDVLYSSEGTDEFTELNTTYFKEIINFLQNTI